LRIRLSIECAVATTWAVLLAVGLVSGWSQAAEPIAVEADSISYERDGGVLLAEGDVHLDWHAATLTAQTLRFERESRRLLGTGGLIFDAPEIRIEADACDLLVDDETGLLFDVNARIKDENAMFGGRRVRKRLGMRYSIKDGYFTTCTTEPGKPPDWELAGEKIDVELEGYGTIEGGRLRIRGIPVLYVPYAAFPARQRRHSGLLFPEFAISNQRGFVYRQPIFWAIDKHSDLTVTTDVETNERLGFAASYRYRPERGIDGQFELEYFNEAIRNFNDNDIVSPLFKLPPGKTLPNNRLELDGYHRQLLTRDLLLYADLLAVSDDLVLREIGTYDGNFFERAVNRSRLYTDSRVGVIGRDAYTSYGVGAKGYQNLTGPVPAPGESVPPPDDRSGSNDLTLQNPFNAWAAHDGRLGPLSYTVEGAVDQFYRDENVDGQRMDLLARVERSLLSNPVLRSYAWASGRFTGYHNDNQTQRDPTGAFVRRLDPYGTRGIVEAGVDVRSGIGRTFRLDADQALQDSATQRTAAKASSPESVGLADMRRFSSLRHTIEPFAGFRFTSNASQNDLPLYDGVDRIDDRTVLTYGVVSRFLFTEAYGGTAELARLSLAQSYNTTEKVLDDHFSDVDLTGAITPVAGMFISGLASYNVGASSLQGAAAAVSYTRFSLPKLDVKRSRVDAIYRYVRKDAVDTETEGLETIEGRTVLALTNTFSVGFNGRYDFVSDRAIEKGGGVRFQAACGCWSIDLGVIDRVNPNELEVLIRFELTGLASVGSSALSYDTPGLATFDRDLIDARRNGW